MRMNKGKPFMHVEAEGVDDFPVFSEAHLYPTLGKDDARFVLGVAEEYEHVIAALGPAAVRAILQVKPRLVERLGVGKEVITSLEDARDMRDLIFEEQHPSEITLDADTAHEIWKVLHMEYRRTYDPEKDLDKDLLLAYNRLTEILGSWEQGERQKERDKLPEKLERQKKAREQGKFKHECVVTVDGEEQKWGIGLSPATYVDLMGDKSEITIVIKHVPPEPEKPKRKRKAKTT